MFYAIQLPTTITGSVVFSLLKAGAISHWRGGGVGNKKNNIANSQYAISGFLSRGRYHGAIIQYICKILSLPIASISYNCWLNPNDAKILFVKR